MFTLAFEPRAFKLSNAVSREMCSTRQIDTGRSINQVVVICHSEVPGHFLLQFKDFMMETCMLLPEVRVHDHW